MTAPPLSLLELALAAALIAISAGLSLWLSLGLAAQLVVAATRAAAQLVLVGLFLRALFSSSSPVPTLAVIAVMFVAAALEVGARQERKLRGAWQYLGGGSVVAVATLGVAVLALSTALRPDPWYAPRHTILLVGFILGTTMNAASLALNAFFSSVARERAAIEARLALGAERYEAFHDLVRRAVRAGAIPILNQMAAAGVITLPGIMTGQVLAGVDPVAAAKMQLLLLFLLGGGGFLAALGAAYVAVGRVTDARVRLRLDRLRPP